VCDKSIDFDDEGDDFTPTMHSYSTSSIMWLWEGLVPGLERDYSVPQLRRVGWKCKDWKMQRTEEEQCNIGLKIWHCRRTN